ncbi:zinc transporter ZIP6 isoform X1 [Esox lucius]|nr:zinc transporter ZIP6 isoform X1 [Esox lucius]
MWMTMRRWATTGLAVLALALCWPYSSGDTGPDCGREFLSTVDAKMAEQTQRQHLEALFDRYGENGTISLAGLKRLLESVGLDRIRKVMVQHHEQPGEGGKEGHRHGHHHNNHRHEGDHNGTHHQKHSHSHPIEPKKISESAKVPEVEEPIVGKKVENLDAHHNLYVKKTTTSVHAMTTTPMYTTHVLVKSGAGRSRRDTDSAPTAGLAPDKQENSLVTKNQTQLPMVRQEGSDDDHLDDHGHEDHRHLQESLHNHSQDHMQEKTECLNASSILSTHGMAKGTLSLSDFSYLCPALLNQIDAKSCIRHSNQLQNVEQDHKLHNHNHHDHHNHDHHDHHSHGHAHEDLSVNENKKGGSIQAAWAGGIISITIISLLSLAGVVLIPLMNRVFFKFLLSFLVALAVGTLSGDAFLHLIPHSQGGHTHHHQHYGNQTPEFGLHGDQEEEHDLDGVWKGLTALGGVYFMFLIEHFLTLGKMYKDKKQKVKKYDQSDDKLDPEKLSALEDNDLKPIEGTMHVHQHFCNACARFSQKVNFYPYRVHHVSLNQKQHEDIKDVETNGAGEFGDHRCDGLHRGSVAEEEEVMLAPAALPEGYASASDLAVVAAAYTAGECENKCHSHFHDTVGEADNLHHHHHEYHHILHHHHSQNHHPHSHSHSYSEQHFQEAGVATLAWMVIMGDGLHNFSDGLAIGAAFTEGLSSGLSTSVAVFCHELPHELGDFAVLLKAGMTVRQAILYNVLSAMMAYLGMITGILIGHYADNICMWIFALTAGLFMYVALVDMVPEMLHNDAGDHGFSHCGFFLLQNAGILLGFCIMLLIAVFEHKIQLKINL